MVIGHVAAIVFFANASLLVLQLVAGRLLAPFIGSSLETWTAIIGVFLMGIAAGNVWGGRIADRDPSPRRLATLLILGAVSAAWMVLLPLLLQSKPLHTLLPLRLRVPVLAFLECFPSAVALSLITPLVIRLGSGSLATAGRAAGRVFAIGTLGCLVGNYFTGFVLIPEFGIRSITLLTAALLLLLSLSALALPSSQANDTNRCQAQVQMPLLSMPVAYAIVFCCSFGGMALELTASRMFAESLGISLYTWTGIIGVMLAGTAVGNTLGGWLAGRGLPTLFICLAVAASLIIITLIAYVPLTGSRILMPLGLRWKIIAATFLLFFPPMLALGTISPQVIALAVRDFAHVGRTAGAIYAVSTLGAIVGTFATGFTLISTFGMYRTVIIAAGLAGIAALLVYARSQKFWALCWVACIWAIVSVGFYFSSPATTGITLETNYFTIRVQEIPDEPRKRGLRLDSLTHSIVDLDNPQFLFYSHEQVQFAFAAKAHHDHPCRLLVIGGGGYTLPRAVATALTGASVDVVEIDPGVTAVSYSHLALDREWGIRDYALDGRQFISEVATHDSYDVITLDAVNDLSVPGHLLTREFNDSLKKCLAPGGVYLVTVIDNPQRGRLWQATVKTLEQSFAHVQTLTIRRDWTADQLDVQIIYASDTPINASTVGRDVRVAPSIPISDLILSDDYAPVDNLMSGIFRERYK